MNRRALPFLIAVLLFSVSVVHAQTSSSVTLNAHVDRATATLGETVLLTIDVAWPPTMDVQLPAAENLNFAPFEVRDAVMTPMPVSAGRKIARFTVRLAAYETGTLTVPAFKLDYKTADKKARTASTRPIEIQIIPPAPSSTDKPGEIRDIKSMDDIPTPSWVYVTAGAGGLLVAIALGLGAAALIRRARRPRPAVTTPHQIALAALQKLLAENLPSRGELKLHYDRLASILREYLARRFGLPVLEHTTNEVVSLMRNRGFEDELRTEIRRVLDEADLVKFAKLSTSEEKALAQIQVVQGIVEKEG